MNFIEELYYGNIRPNEGRWIDNSQYKKAFETIEKSEEVLLNRLLREDKSTFIDFANASSEITAIENIDNFKMGFALGALLMIDCFKEGKSVLKDDV